MSLRNLRIGLYELAAIHSLDEAATHQLQQLAGLQDAPAGLARGWYRGLAVLASALFGLGLIMWVAANWEALGRTQRFALLQGLVLLMCLGAILRPAARAPLALIAMLGTGALFACFGQTYQTGADPWQLFVAWTLLTLPLCMATRSDVLWAPWALIAMCASALWERAHTDDLWRVSSDDLAAHALAWGVSAALVILLGRWLGRYTGAGVWALRTAATLAVVEITATAASALFRSPLAPEYGVALVLLAVMALAFACRPAFDMYVLSAASLGLNVLLVGWLGHYLFSRENYSSPPGNLLLTGLAAAGLLGASVSLILRLARAHAEAENAAINPAGESA